MFMTVLGKVMAPFPYGEGGGAWEVLHTTHTLMHFGFEGGGKLGSGSLVVFLSLHHNLTSVLSAAETCPTPRSGEEVGSKRET